MKNAAHDNFTSKKILLSSPGISGQGTRTWISSISTYTSLALTSHVLDICQDIDFQTQKEISWQLDSYSTLSNAIITQDLDQINLHHPATCTIEVRLGRGTHIHGSNKEKCRDIKVQNNKESRGEVHFFCEKIIQKDMPE